MFTNSAPQTSLHEKQARRLVSAQISVIVAVFFAAAYFILNWTLTTEARFMQEGVTRQFVQWEALACALVASLGFLAAAKSAGAWLVSAVMNRKRGADLTKRQTVQHSVRRIGAYV